MNFYIISLFTAEKSRRQDEDGANDEFLNAGK